MSADSGLSRRHFLGAALSVGGSVLFYEAVGASRAAFAAATDPALASGTLVSGWIRIAPDGAVTALSRTTELGQGATTSLALLVAEELEVDANTIRIEMAPVQDAYMEHDSTLGYGTHTAYYVTWGSLSSRDMERSMRKIAATARALLLRAAAQSWGVPEAECHAEGGTVRHVGGRLLSYGALAPLAAPLPVPQDVEPKPRARWRRLGRPTMRHDIPAKVDGSTIYGVDVQRPGMLVATIAQCPQFGGTLESVDSSAVEHLPGVKQVIRLPEALAVVATDYWSARRALKALRPVWRRGERTPTDSAAHAETLRRAVLSPAHLFLPEGAHQEQVLAAHASGLSAGSLHLEALYELPFLAHAPMEPMNATAHVTAEQAELWVPTQYQSMVQEVVAEILGLAREKVIVHTTAVGGGFGRRTEVDYAIQAAHIARHVAQPVKLIWSREEDTSRGYFRPMTVVRVQAALSTSGDPTAFAFTAACPSIMDYSVERRHGTPYEEVEEAGLATARNWPYEIPAQKIALASVDLGVPVTWMRSVGSAASVFALECFLDEMAGAAKADPVAYRRHLLRHRPRELAVLERLAALASWGRPAPAGRHRGIALNCANGSVVAQSVELEVSPSGAVTLHDLHCVVDCGAAFNPASVVAQMEGGSIFGLTSTFFGEITLKDGAVVQKNFDSYPLVTLAQTPRIHVEILPSDAPIGGVGEEGVPAVAAAVVNALSAATGRRIRTLPLSRQGFTLADAGA